MSKCFVMLCFGESVENPPGSGIYELIMTDRCYYGDVIKLSSKVEIGESINDNINLNNRISIIADPYAYNNFSTLKYVVWMGVKWKIKSVEVERPRLILTIGDIYNE